MMSDRDKIFDILETTKLVAEKVEEAALKHTEMLNLLRDQINKLGERIALLEKRVNALEVKE